MLALLQGFLTLLWFAAVRLVKKNILEYSAWMKKISVAGTGEAHFVLYFKSEL
jgi:hypothetical protein